MDFLRNPMFASIFAALITIVYMHIKSYINSEEAKTSTYMKPATLVAILVYGIVYYGNTSKPRGPEPY
jgi:formate hydrogenlyase subunit 4